MSNLLDEPMTTSAPPRRSRRRLGWVAVAAGLVISLLAIALVWWQPQKLFIDDKVNEAIPSAVESSPAAPEPQPDSAPEPGADAGPSITAPPAVSTEPTEVARGTFVSLDHGTTGVSRVLELADGRRVVRLEGLDTSNGPDLFVYLTGTRADGSEASFDDNFVNLGRLKGNQGDQNYDLPADTDLSQFATVLIWCDRFNSAFGAADLTLA